MTGGGANKLVKDVSRDSVITALVPICLYLAQNDENRNLKLLGYKDASSYKRRDMVMDAGWATMPGSSIPDRELAQACTDELLN